MHPKLAIDRLETFNHRHRNHNRHHQSYNDVAELQSHSVNSKGWHISTDERPTGMLIKVKKERQKEREGKRGRKKIRNKKRKK